MRKKTVLRIIILIFIVLWMMLIFGLSNQNGEESSFLSQKISSLFTKDSEKIQIIEPYIRKIAHLSEYAFGGFLFISLFMTYNFSDRKRLILSFCIGVEYAVLDEIHQLFISDRSGQITDVLIDSIGVALGICITMLFYKVIMKLYKRKDGVSK